MLKFFAFCFDRYEGKAFLFILALTTGVRAYPQTIEYSRQNFKAPYFDAIQLVPNVSGYHHVLCFTHNKKVALYVYDDALQLKLAKELEVNLHEYDDINIIPFTGFYYLYLHQPSSSKHEIWKVDPHGDATPVTKPFQNLIDTVFKKNTATLHLVNENNQLTIIGNTYYPQIEKIRSSVVRADENLNIIVTKRVFYDFKRNRDNLKKVMLVGSDMLILKTSKDSSGHLVQMVKVNLDTGLSLINTFNSGSNVFANPTFNYSKKDSSILIYSAIQKTMFITKLDYFLNEKAPVTILKNQFRNNTAVNFLQLKDHTGPWIYMPLHRFSYSPADVWRPGFGAAFIFNQLFDNYGNLIHDNSPYYTGRYTNSSRLSSSYTSPGYSDRSGDASAIRFSLLNDDFTIYKDTIAQNDKNFYSISTRQSASVRIQNQSYLFLNQLFGKSRHGLLMVYGNSKGELLTTDIRVFDKYEYLLPQLRAVDNKFVILPYRYKRELGLVKITIE